jgi:homoserine dehydrogenase
VANVFAAHDVSIASVRQGPAPGSPSEDAILVIVTHTAPDAALASTVAQLRTLDVVRSIASVLRVEGD